MQHKRTLSEASRKSDLSNDPISTHYRRIHANQKLYFNSAKELEHYQRVRAAFEGPTKTKTSAAPNPLSLPASSPGKEKFSASHLHPPAPASRRQPKPVRTNTARKDDPKGKGKGKVTKWESDDDDDDDDDDDAYVTSNDTMGTPERRPNGLFNNGTADDDEEMYH